MICTLQRSQDDYGNIMQLVMAPDIFYEVHMKGHISKHVRLVSYVEQGVTGESLLQSISSTIAILV